MTTASLHEVRCISCARLVGHARVAKAKTVYCTDPMCPGLPPLIRGNGWENDTRDSAIWTLFSMGWVATHLADLFDISRQRVVQVVQARGLQGTRREQGNGKADVHGTRR